MAGAADPPPTRADPAAPLVPSDPAPDAPAPDAPAPGSPASAGLSAVQREAVVTFRAVTAAGAGPAAVVALRAAAWNVQDAVEAHFSGAAARGAPPAAPAPAPPAPPAPRAVRAPRPRPRWLLLLLSPVRVLLSLLRRAAAAATRLLGGAGAALAAAPGGDDAARFRAFYRARHGDEHAEFFAGGYMDALAAAQARAAFLLVYLHAEGHPATRGFCARVLAHPRFVQAAATGDFVLWAAGVTQPDGAAAQAALRAPGFPFLAVVHPPRARVRPDLPRPPLRPAHFGRVLSVRAGGAAAALDGNGAADWLAAVGVRFARLLDGVREERAARERDRRIIDEQNAEFARSLEADRERERERALAAAAAARAEAEERARGEREAREAGEREERRRRKREALGVEAEVGPGVCKVMLRLPDGTRVSRRFERGDKLERVFDWAEVNSVDIEVACLVTSYPRKRFRYPEEAGQSLGEAGLFPSAMLLLEERGEDE